MTKYPYHITLNLLGAYVLVQCTHVTCRDGIAKHYSAAIVDEPWCTPDVILRCDWETAERYLFRARPRLEPEILEGICLKIHGQTDYTPWNSYHQPLPPFTLAPFAQRFAALHGGAVITPRGNVLLFLGDRESGKTTTALDLVNQQGCQLLTDETVLVHRRTNLVEPFARETGLRMMENGEVINKVPVAAVAAYQRIATRPALAEGIVFLTKSAAPMYPQMQQLTELTTLTYLLKHNLFAGLSQDEELVTFVQLARKATALEFQYHAYDDLKTGITNFLQVLSTKVTE